MPSRQVLIGVRRGIVRFRPPTPLPAALPAGLPAGLAGTLAVTLAVTLAGALVAGSIAGCGQSLGGGDQAGQVKGTVRIATGGSSAVYYTYGTAYAKLISQRLPKVHSKVLVTGASAENIEMILDGTAEIAFTQADATLAAKPGRLTALARLYDDHLHLVVAADSGLNRLTDLRHHRVSIGGAGSGTTVTVERLLHVASLRLGRDLEGCRLGLEDSITAFREHRLDAFFFSGGLPVGPIAELAKLTKIRLIDLHEYLAPLSEQFGAYYSERVLPASTYGVNAVTSIGVANYLVASPALPTDLAFELTRTLLGGRESLAAAHPAGARLSERGAIGTKPLPLHPGAVRYYRQAKA